MISTAFFLAAAIEAVTFAATAICLAGEDDASPEMREDALKVFSIGTTLAALAAGSHFVNW